MTAAATGPMPATCMENSTDRVDVPPRQGVHPPKARPRAVPVNAGDREHFLRLPLEERKRRIRAFIDHFAPAFADFTSEDFRAAQRREAGNDS